MKLYAGIDLHSANSYLAIIDSDGKRIFKQKMPNRIELIVEALSLYSGTLCGVVVESTYNWYWLVDGLMAAGFAVHLANPAARVAMSSIRSPLTWMRDVYILRSNLCGHIWIT